MKKLWEQAMNFWNAKPSHAQYEVWFKEMQRYDKNIIAQGFEMLKRTKRYFPTTDEWLAIVDSIDDVQRDKETKRQNLDAKDFWTKPANDWKPLIALLKGELTRGEFLEMMKAKGVDMSKLESFYKKQDLPLNLKPATQDFKKRIPEKYKENATFKDGKEA